MNTDTEPQAANVTTEYLYFWTKGEDMTRTARDFCREGRHEDAARLLVEGIGMSWDQAYDILAGKTRLNGNSKKVKDGGTGGMGLEDDGPENEETAEYLEDIHTYYAGRYRYGDKWFRPYAYVTGFNRQDLEGAYDGGAPRDLVMARHWGDMPWRRAMHYADRPGQDLAHILPVPGIYTGDGEMDRWVLFEQTNAPPPWLPNQNNNDEAKALRDWFCQGHRLQARGPDKLLSEMERGLLSDALDERDIEAAVEEPLNTQRVASALNAASRLQKKADDKRRRREEAESEAADEARYLAKLTFYRKEIREQAEESGGYFTLKVPREEGDSRPTSYQVPRAPFEYWSLWRTNLRHLAPEWQTVCEQGLKMYSDDATHSDWMVGAEPPIPLESWHGYGAESDKALLSASLDAQEEVQKRVGDFEITVMCGTGVARGPVIHPKPDQEVPAGSIIVIPYGSPDYAIPAMSAGRGGAVITEVGGRLSHLAVLGAEMDLRLVRIEDALTLYPEGDEVTVDCNRGRITVETRNVRGMLGEYES